MTNDDKREIAVNYFGYLIGAALVGLLERLAGKTPVKTNYQSEVSQPSDPEEDTFDEAAYRELQASKIDECAWHSVTEVGQIVGCARQTVYEWVKAGFLPQGDYNGENIRWRGDLLKEWLAWRAGWDGSDLGSYRRAIETGDCEPFSRGSDGF